VNPARRFHVPRAPDQEASEPRPSKATVVGRWATAAARSTSCSYGGACRSVAIQVGIKGIPQSADRPRPAWGEGPLLFVKSSCVNIH